MPAAASNAGAAGAAGAGPEGALNFYDVLATYPEATPSQIKQAYRSAARRWHPDKAQAEDKELCEHRFKMIGEAYEVLSDPPVRQLYDMYLRCAEEGVVELADPSDPTGQSFDTVATRDWPHFRKMFGANAREYQDMARYEEEAEADAAAEPPVTCTEWCIAGGLLFAMLWFASWRSQRRALLQSMPLWLWELHNEVSMPISILLSPFFFGNVPFREAQAWMKASLLGMLEE